MKTNNIFKKSILYICSSLLVFSSAFVYSSADNEQQTTQMSGVIVTLGDSYSSGEGNPPFYGQPSNWEYLYNGLMNGVSGIKDTFLSKVSDKDWLAHRSEKSWGGMLQHPALDQPMSEYHDTGNLQNKWFFYAASGATTEHLYKEQTKKWFLYAASDEEKLPAQLDILKKLKENNITPDYVTITIGGNDVGFADIITAAAIPNSNLFNINKTKNKLDKAWKLYNGKSKDDENSVKNKLYNAYKNIAAETGEHTKILVAGYPTLISESKLDLMNYSLLFNSKEAVEINKAVSEFNKKIEKIVETCHKNDNINIKFVSVEDEFKGHEAYSSKGAFINELMKKQKEDLNDLSKVMDNSTDVGKFLKNIIESRVSSYSMHPNIYGQRAYAKCVQDEIDGKTSDNKKTTKKTKTTKASTTKKNTSVDWTSAAEDAIYNYISYDDKMAYDNKLFFFLMDVDGDSVPEIFEGKSGGSATFTVATFMYWDGAKYSPGTIDTPDGCLYNITPYKNKSTSKTEIWEHALPTDIKDFTNFIATGELYLFQNTNRIKLENGVISIDKTIDNSDIIDAFDFENSIGSMAKNVLNKVKEAISNFYDQYEVDNNAKYSYETFDASEFMNNGFTADGYHKIVSQSDAKRIVSNYKTNSSAGHFKNITDLYR